MRMDDLLALGAIAAGALASLAVSLALVLSPAFRSPPTSEVAPPPAHTSRPDCTVVDFAIIRDGAESGPELMVGPDAWPQPSRNPTQFPDPHPGR